jgi:hypothetical protein
MEWHIQDFPKELVVKLKDGYLRKVAESIGGQRKTARMLGVSFPSLHQVISGERAISLRRLFKIIELSPQKEELMKNLEKNIIAIKAPSSRAYWIRMKLPLMLTPELARIIGHILGDGNIRRTKGSNVRYGNKYHQLVYQFISDMKKVFGKSIYTIWIGKRGQTENFMEVSCPSVIGRIIKRIFGKFGTYDGKIPKIIMRSNLKIKRALLKSIFDDECTVQDGLIIALTNKKLIQQIGNLLSEFHIQHHYGTRKDKRLNRKLQYTLSIYGKKNLERFYEKIGLDHPFKRVKMEKWKKK